MNRRPNGFWIASALFLLSGAGGLAYEVIWFKRFSHLWGGSSFAMAAVVTSFLLGLALGAESGGRWADRATRPLRLYALCELAIGLLAILVPFEILGLFKLSELLYPLLEPQPWLQAPVRLLLSFLVMGPPCFLMGATLPLMIRSFAASGLGEFTGWFYGVNTLGAAIGCFAAGFALLPLVGLLWTNIIAAAINLMVAGAAWSLARRVEPREPEPESPAGSRSVLVAAALTGTAALMLQIVWARQISVMVGGSTYAIATTIGVFLLGIGLGGLVFHFLLRDGRRLGEVILALAATAIAGQLLIPVLTDAVGYAIGKRASFLGNGLVCAMAGGVLEFLPTLAMGALFPMLASRLPGAGRAIGRLYAWNTVGAIAGAAATSALLVPLLGAARTFAAALGFYAVALVILVDVRPVWAYAARAATAVGIVAFAFTLSPDPRRTDLGEYLYGVDLGYRSRVKILQFAEGRACNVLVTAEGSGAALRVNGKVDANTYSDMPTQLGLAYFPRFFVPEAHDVLIIGYGSGTTAGASLLFPGTKVEVAELEPMVFAASPRFWSHNHQPELHPGFSIRFDDGRAVVQGTRRTYDLVISESSNVWIAGASSLFTVEFYDAVRRRLNPGGILAQWVQTYDFSLAEFATIVRTIRQAFPYACLARIHEIGGNDMILMASDRPLTTRPIAASSKLVSRHPVIQRDLQTYFQSTDVAGLLLTYVVLDEEGVKRLMRDAPPGPIHTDLNLRLEFDAPLRLFGDTRPEGLAIHKAVDRAAHPIWIREAWKAWKCGPEQTAALRRISALYQRNGENALARQTVSLGLLADPGSPYFLAESVLLLDRPPLPQVQAAVSALLRTSEAEAVRLAKTLIERRRNDEAAVVLACFLAERPASATAWALAGVNLLDQGKIPEARDALKKAMSIEPGHALAQATWNAHKDRLE